MMQANIATQLSLANVDPYKNGEYKTIYQGSLIILNFLGFEWEGVTFEY